MDTASQEEGLVLACCKAIIFDDNSQVSKDLIQNAFESDKLLKFIRAHRLELVVNKVIDHLKIESPHPNYLELKSKSRHITNNQLILRKALIEVHTFLNKYNIVHLFLKGPPLNFMLYGHKACRYSKDIDVLVKPSDVLFIDKQLRGRGYLCDIDSEEIKLHLRANTKQDIVYKRPGAMYTIELHWKADYLDRLLTSKEEWVAEISYFAFCNQNIPVLSPYKNVVYLCFHGAKHGWHRLFWLLDIVLFIRKYQIDILTLIALSKQDKMEGSVFEMLFLAKILFGIQWAGSLQNAYRKELKDAAIRCDLKARKMNRHRVSKKIAAFTDLWHADYRGDRRYSRSLLNKIHLIRLIMTNIAIRVFYKVKKIFTRVKGAE